MKAIATLTLAGLCAALLSTTTTRADEPGLSPGQILEQLQKLDKNAKSNTLRDKEGRETGTQFIFTVVRGGMNIPIAMTANRVVIWMSVNATDVPDVTKLPQATLVNLLEAHIRTGPSFFRLRKTNKGHALEMGHRIERDSSAELLRNRIDEFVTDVLITRDLWTSIAREQIAAGK